MCCNPAGMTPTIMNGCPDSDRLPDDLRVRTKTALPKRMAQDYFAVVTLRFLSFGELPAKLGREPEHVKETGADAHADEPLRAVVGCQLQVATRVRGQGNKGVLAAMIEKVARGHRERWEVRLGVALEDEEQTVR